MCVPRILVGDALPLAFLGEIWCDCCSCCCHAGLDTGLGFAGLRAGLAWLGVAWLGLAWLGLVWLGLAWLGLAFPPHPTPQAPYHPLGGFGAWG